MQVLPALPTNFGTTMSEKPLKVVFEPGCFDSFEGSQEELDELIKLIETQVASGEFFANSTEVTDEMFEELDPAEQAAILQALENSEPKRKLQ